MPRLTDNRASPVRHLHLLARQFRAARVRLYIAPALRNLNAVNRSHHSADNVGTKAWHALSWVGFSASAFATLCVCGHRAVLPLPPVVNPWHEIHLTPQNGLRPRLRSLSCRYGG